MYRNTPCLYVSAIGQTTEHAKDWGSMKQAGYIKIDNSYLLYVIACCRRQMSWNFV